MNPVYILVHYKSIVNAFNPKSKLGNTFYKNYQTGALCDCTQMCWTVY